jgi:hypothetical protein
MLGSKSDKEVTTMTLPGFTAEASRYRASGRYRAQAGTFTGLVAAGLTLALDNSSFGTTATVDCKTFPDSITCHECNSTGPGTFNCCELGGMRNPGDSCIIVNDPNALSNPGTPTSRFPRIPTAGRRLGNLILRGA